MRVCTLVALLLFVILTLDVLGQCEGWWSGGSSSSSSSSSPSSSSSSRSSSRRTSSSRRSSSSSSGSKSSSGGWWGGRSRSSSSKGSSSSSSSSKVSVTKTERGTTIKANGKTVHVGKTGIRDRDKTGHRTGLGTLAKKMKSQPLKTLKAGYQMAKSYLKMRKANIKGGNLKAHEEANRKATEVSDAETAEALSALREQYKRVRPPKKNPDGSVHIGDTRTQKEIDDTMNANKKGRESAKPNDNR